MKIEQTIYTLHIKEVTARKYAQLTGIKEETVKRFCRMGRLKARKIKDDGTLVTDYKTDKKGTWYVDTTTPIRE